MKKLFCLLICLLFSFSFVNARTPTLDDIAKTYNNMQMIKDYASANAYWSANVQDNKLIITTSVDGNNTSTTFNLEGNILSISASGEQVFTYSIVSNSVVDAVQIIQGYKEGEIYSSLNSKLIFNYSLDKEGIEIKSSDTEYSLKLDISKKIPLIDLSDEYFMKDDLAEFKTYLTGSGSCEGTKGNVYYNKSDDAYGNVTLLVGEKNKLTQVSYKSIVSLVEVIFDDVESSSYFVKNYPYLDGNKEFDGFKVEIEPAKSDWEKLVFDKVPGYKMVRITINKEDAKKAFTGIELDNGKNDIVTPPVSDSKTESENNNNIIQPTDDNGIMINIDSPLIFGGLLLGSAILVLFVAIALIKFRKSKKVEAKNDEDIPKLDEGETTKKIEVPDYMDSSDKINLTSDQEHVIFKDDKEEIDISNIPFQDEKNNILAPDYMSTDEKIDIDPNVSVPLVNDAKMILPTAEIDKSMMSEKSVHIDPPNPLDTDINMGPNSDIHVSDEKGIEKINVIKAPNSMSTSGVHFENNNSIKTNDNGLKEENKDENVSHNTICNVKAPNSLNTTGINMRKDE